MLPTTAGNILLKRCESKRELEHQKYEKYGLQFACLMQSGINGHEIYKNVSMMHAVVFADRAPEAKNAQVIGDTIPMGSKSGKIAIGTARRAKRANTMGKNALVEAVWGGKK